METFKVEGIILRTTNFGEANKVVTLYTKKFGKLELNAYGCRRAKSSMAGALQLFNEISAEVSRGARVDVIRDADVVKFYGNLTEDVERLSYASIFFEIVSKLTLPKFPEAGVYEILRESLAALSKKSARKSALTGVCQFLEFSGIQLSYFECVRCGEKISGDAKISLKDGGAICKKCFKLEDFDYPESARRAFEEILKFDWRREINLSEEQIELAEEILWRYIESVLGKKLNALKFLRQVERLQKN